MQLDIGSALASQQGPYATIVAPERAHCGASATSSHYASITLLVTQAQSLPVHAGNAAIQRRIQKITHMYMSHNQRNRQDVTTIRQNIIQAHTIALIGNMMDMLRLDKDVEILPFLTPYSLALKTIQLPNNFQKPPIFEPYTMITNI